jgi:hypothetical protein
VQIAEYANTPAFVRKRYAGAPLAATNFWEEPTGNLESFTIFFGAAAMADCVRPKTKAPAEIAAVRRKPLRFIRVFS